MMRGDAMKMYCWKDGPAATRMQRELPYRCSNGSGRAMGSSTGCSNAEDVGQGGLALAQVLCRIINVMLSEEYY